MTRLKIKSYLLAKLNDFDGFRQSEIMICDTEKCTFNNFFEYEDEEIREIKKKRLDDDGIKAIVERRTHTHGNYRWRWGTLVGKPTIVKEIFEYPEDVTPQEIILMEDVVWLIESLIDSILDYRAHGEVRKRKQEEKERRERRQYHIEEAEKIIQDQKEKADHLYLMRHVNGLTKIGRSGKPEARERTLQAEDPRLELIYVGEHLGWLEKRFHDMFADERVRGEWFDLKEHRVDWIKYYCELKTRNELSESFNFNGNNN